jgi:Ca2+-binding RTX toxin-like protein
MAQVFETSNNDTIATATNLGNIRNSPFVKGDLFGTDTADFFKFQVDRPTKGGIAVVPQGVDPNLVLFNSSGQVIRSSVKPGTATEGISFDNLPTGEYTVLVSKSTGSGSYTLSANGTAITRAELSVTVDRVTALSGFDTPVPFTNVGQADFFINSSLDGTNLKSGVFDNDNDISPNFTLRKSVDINKSVFNGSISVKEDDTPFDDTADINPGSGTGLNFTFNAIKNEVQPGTASTFPIKREGERITVEGNSGDRARVSFHVDYNTFTSSTSSFNNSTPVIRGTNASQNLIGQNQSGILHGEGGNDRLLGMGGNDALCGGTGNDRINGGTGNDISYGGAGRDVHTGGTGRDTFVLTLDSGVDVIKDFQNGRDRLGLSMELNPEILDIVQRGKNTIVGVGDHRLAVLSNVKADQITAADFVTVDFTRFKGMEVPTLVA